MTTTDKNKHTPITFSTGSILLPPGVSPLPTKKSQDTLLETPAPLLESYSDVSFPTLKSAIRQTEISLITEAMRLSNGNQSKAAVLLGINRNTLSYKVLEYNIPYNEKFTKKIST